MRVASSGSDSEAYASALLAVLPVLFGSTEAVSNRVPAAIGGGSVGPLSTAPRQ